MANILFIGGAGFIGSCIIKNMLQSSHDFNVFVIEPPFASLSRLEGLNVKVIKGELVNLDIMFLTLEAYKIDTVVHLVSTIIPGSDFENYKREYQNVIFPTIEIMKFCAERKIKFVYFSSGGTIYGDTTDLRKFKETDPMLPISYYGWSKQMMENSIHYVHRTAGLEYLILRPSNPYGYGQNVYGKQGLVAVAIGKILSGEPIQIWGDGSNVRDYIYIDDLAKIVVQLLSKGIDNITLNIGSGTGNSITEILNELKDIVAEEVKIEFLPSRKVDVSNMILDVSELKKYVEWEETPLHQGISHFYQDVKLNLKL